MPKRIQSSELNYQGALRFLVEHFGWSWYELARQIRAHAYRSVLDVSHKRRPLPPLALVRAIRLAIKEGIGERFVDLLLEEVDQVDVKPLSDEDLLLQEMKSIGRKNRRGRRQ